MKCPHCGEIIEKRTNQQNRALYKYYDLLAEALNSAGYSVQVVLRKKVDVSWDYKKVKSLLWDPAQEAILGVKSTTELKKQKDIDIVYDHLNLHLSEKFHVHVPFPSEEEMAMRKAYGKRVAK